MNFIKKQGVGFILNAVLAILTIVSMIIYAVNKGLPYFTEANVSWQIMLFLILALVCVLANIAIGFTPLKGNKIATICADILLIASAFFLVGAGIYFMYDRVYYYGIALFSDLESGNPVAKSGCIQAMVATGFMFASGILAVVNNFVCKTPSEE